MDHIVTATPEDELGMNHVRKIDGDVNNNTLIQRVMQGHFTDWNKMAKVVSDRGEAGEIYEKLQRATVEVKAQVVAILDAKPVEPKEPIITK